MIEKQGISPCPMGDTKMKKIIPAVWFQNKLNGPPAKVRKPARLELLESELAQVGGGYRVSGGGTDSCSNCVPDDCLD